MPNYSGATASADGSERVGGGASDLRGDLLAFSVARQAAMGQEEIFRAVKALRDENERLVDRCKALGREVSLTQAENKQLAGHISRVLGLTVMRVIRTAWTAARRQPRADHFFGRSIT